MTQLNISLPLFKTHSASIWLLSQLSLHMLVLQSSDTQSFQTAAHCSNTEFLEDRNILLTGKQKAFIALSPSDNSQLQVEALH